MRFSIALIALLLVCLDSFAEDGSKNPLLGDWALVSAEGGILAAAMKANIARIQIDSDRITAGRPAEYSIDTAKNEIEIRIEGGPKDEQGTLKGIYELKNRTLKIHLSSAGKPRPSNLTPDSSSVLLTLSKGK